MTVKINETKTCRTEGKDKSTVIVGNFSTPLS